MNIEEAIRSRAEEGGKTVVGVPGTPSPSRDKESLLVTYIISGGGTRPAFTDSFEEGVQRKINGRPEFDGYTVTFHKSGVSSAKPFREQAVAVEVPGSALPVRGSDLDRIRGIVEREVDGLKIKDRVVDMRGQS